MSASLQVETHSASQSSSSNPVGFVTKAHVYRMGVTPARITISSAVYLSQKARLFL